MNYGKKIECWWVEFSIFFSKFLIFKGVISPRNQWRNPIKMKHFVFHNMMKRGINLTFSRWIMGKKNWVLVEIFKFSSKFLIFKCVFFKKTALYWNGNEAWEHLSQVGAVKVLVAHEISDKILQKFIILIFMVWWREVLIILSPDEIWANFLVLVEIFNFWSKFLIYKGVGPRNDWRN